MPERISKPLVFHNPLYGTGTTRGTRGIILGECQLRMTP